MVRTNAMGNRPIQNSGDAPAHPRHGFGGPPAHRIQDLNDMRMFDVRHPEAPQLRIDVDLKQTLVRWLSGQIPTSQLRHFLGGVSECRHQHRRTLCLHRHHSTLSLVLLESRDTAVMLRSECELVTRTNANCRRENHPADADGDTDVGIPSHGHRDTIPTPSSSARVIQPGWNEQKSTRAMRRGRAEATAEVTKASGAMNALGDCTSAPSGNQRWCRS